MEKTMTFEERLAEVETIAAQLEEGKLADGIREHKFRLEERVSPYELVEAPVLCQQLVHAAEDEVAALAHDDEVHAVGNSHLCGLVYLRLDGVDWRALRLHFR